MERWGKDRNENCSNISSLCNWKRVLPFPGTGRWGEGTSSDRLGREVGRSDAMDLRDVQREWAAAHRVTWPWPTGSSHVLLLCVIIWDHVCVISPAVPEEPYRTGVCAPPPQYLAQSLTPLVPVLWDVNLEYFSGGTSTRTRPHRKGGSLALLLPSRGLKVPPSHTPGIQVRDFIPVNFGIKFQNEGTF